MDKITNQIKLPTPTEEQFQSLNRAYRYFNEKLFDGKLPDCILNFSRKRNTHGFLAPNRWRRVEEQEYSTHEISLTPLTLYRSPIEVFSTLVHEQAHLWQWEFGSPSRSGYHNREWADKMEELGLMPTDTGKEGGKRTGQKMTHMIIEGGAYQKVFNEMPEEYLLPFASLEGDLFRSLINGGSGTNGKDDPRTKRLKKLRPPSRNKTKYSCPSCRVNVWGKPQLKIVCGDCETSFEVAG